MGVTVMFRKKRQPAPYFRTAGSPFNPATGERAPIGRTPQKGTTLALMQVIGDPPHTSAQADTHDNYVVCRGYEVDHDPIFRYLHDPYTKPDTTPIHVAKPYSIRGTFPYTLGQVIVAARILHRLGHNVGKAETTVGQPADLDEEVVLLYDDDDVGIAWMDIGQNGGTVLGKPDANIDNGASGTISIWTGDPGSEVDSGENITAWVRGAAVLQGQWVTLQTINGEWYIAELTNEAIGKPDSDISKGGSGTVSIWTGPGGSESDSGINVTAYAKGAAVTAGKFVILGNINGVWYCAPWES